MKVPAAGSWAVLGAGAWGTALSCVLASRGVGVRLWSRSPQRAGELARSRTTAKLPGFALPAEVAVEHELATVLGGVEFALLALPSQALRATLRAASHAGFDACLVLASKGIERGSLLTPSQVVADELGAQAMQRTAVVSGPSFALEVAQGLPTSVVCASANQELVARLQGILSSERLRIYSSSDVVGVEVGGALKNVIAIAVGACDALGFGLNTQAALITRGVAEVARLARALGGEELTVSGLSGLGDLVLTCSGALSRNRKVGYLLGQGLGLEQILGQLGHVAEGVETAQSAVQLADRLGVDLPITRAVHSVVAGLKQPREAVADLLARSLKAEWE